MVSGRRQAISVKVYIPTPFLKLTRGVGDAEVMPGTIIDLIHDLDRQFPGMEEGILEGGKVRGFVNIYVNEEDIQLLKAEETLVRDGDEVSIVPAIAGG
jgi:molybdopterin synthase sulfur carrier subunit